MKDRVFYFITLTFLMIFFQKLQASTDYINVEKSLDRKNKILVLIIASDDQPAYIKLQQIWRAYMHLVMDPIF